MARKRGQPKPEPATRSKKTGVVTFRVDDEQQAALDLAARSEGDTLGNWCRRHLLRLAGWKYTNNEERA